MKRAPYWLDARPEPLPMLQGSKTADAVVIGGGIAGDIRAVARLRKSTLRGDAAQIKKRRPWVFTPLVAAVLALLALSKRRR